ncbi:hypothetical protein LCGC14_1922470, partial [marine sediment metagenome]
YVRSVLVASGLEVGDGMDSQPESVSDEGLRRVMQQSIEEHEERRHNTADNIEVMRLGRFRWKYRFYWGRYVANPAAPVVAWTDYESGTRMTRNWAFVAACWHLSKLQTKDARKWESE